MSHIAKIFKNGRSQAVRLPAAYRFDSKEVFVHRDPETGDVILSRKPENWDGFLTALQKTDVPRDFLNKSECVQGGPSPGGGRHSKQIVVGNDMSRI